MAAPQPLPPIDVPATPQSPPAAPQKPLTPPPAANDNHPPAANDNNPKSNAPGKIMTWAGRLKRAGVVFEGAKLVGRVLFDPHLFGDNSAYFADTPTADAAERALVKQGEIDIKQNGMDPTMVKRRVAEAIRQKRIKERADRKAAREAEREQNVKTHGECKVLAMEIYAQAEVVKGRYLDLVADKLDLFNKAFSAPSPSLPVGSGSWTGHITQFNIQQGHLRDKILEYDNLGCKEPPIGGSIRALATVKPPSAPGGTPGYPFTAL